MTAQETKRQDVLDFASRLVSQLEAMRDKRRAGIEYWPEMAEKATELAAEFHGSTAEFVAALRIKYAESSGPCRCGAAELHDDGHSRACVRYYVVHASRMADMLLDDLGDLDGSNFVAEYADLEDD